MSEIEYLGTTIELIAEEYFNWRKSNQTKQPHEVTFEAFLATKLELL